MPSKTILPSRGLRQVDPLSPYLFILALDNLLRNLHDQAIKRNMFSLKSSNKGPLIPALAFANDCIFFIRPDKKSIETLKNYLSNFFDALGQTINLQKSHCLFSPKTPKYYRRLVKSSFGIKSLKWQNNYLGFPLINGRVTKIIFSRIIENMDSKLNLWYTKSLNYAGSYLQMSLRQRTSPKYVNTSSIS